MIKITVFTALILFSSIVNAWTPSGSSLTVKGIIEWEGNEHVVVWLSNDIKCYVPSNESNLISFVYALYLNQKSASWHCHDAETNVGGYKAHRLHRVVALQ
ncbi:hypothetical protein R1T43_01325 [Alteromonas sp. CI.11.F.A3]|uniref:hypothetical protein n=1 Tax=Alteromonas sp. CI.11.F.A3 TaxID=3079555 RepID=UPI002942E96D|nr:hypothetical protein [Alteromonas sp. CI.11.F.A3]WOI37707.1 hypothetical protein R1T43_01325 [Alteromonas sp. CI.11.F.A3]